MLANLAKAFELKESTITAPALQRTWLFYWLSLPMFPAIFWIELTQGEMAETIALIIGLVLLIGFIALLGLGFSRLVNRFYFADKYLDEWEIRIKHKSFVFAAQLTLPLIGLTGVVLFSLPESIRSRMSPLDAESLGLVLFAIVMLFFYLQLLRALQLVEPMDADEEEHAGDKGTDAPWYRTGFFWAVLGLVVVSSVIIGFLGSETFAALFK